MTTAPTPSELLPCPFCGAGNTEIRDNGKVWSGMGYTAPTSTSVFHQCRPVAGQPSSAIERVGRDRASAIAAWNQRAELEARKPLPLSDEQIDAIADGMPGGLGGFMKTWGWRQFARKILDLRAPPTWEPGFDFMVPGQEELAMQFCLEIAGPRGKKGSPPDPVRLLEMAQALYKAEADAQMVDKSPNLQEPLVDKTANLQDQPAALSDDDRLRLRSDVARAIWDVMREHEDRCDHALEDVDHKHPVWDCADAAIETALGIIPRPNPLIASREVVADGPLRVTRLNLTDEGRAALTSKVASPLPSITGGSS